MDNIRHFIFIINGHNGSGKDTFVEIVRDLVAPDTSASDNSYTMPKYSILNTSTIDPIKAMLKRRNLWNGEKDDASRKLLSDVKAICDKYSDYTTKEACLNVKTFRLRYPTLRTVTFIHCREPEKIELLKSKLEETEGSISMIGTILVRRDSEVANNESDRNVENYKYDIYIDNNGTKEALIEKANDFIRTLDTLSGYNNDTTE